MSQVGLVVATQVTYIRGTSKEHNNSLLRALGAGFRRTVVPDKPAPASRPAISA